MASGYFSCGEQKKRPGLYVDFVSTAPVVTEASERGVAVLPVVASYGTKGNITEINADNASSFFASLGFSATDKDANMLLVREMLKKATIVKVFILNSGEKATATIGDVVVTAKHPGSRGNDIKVVIEANAVKGGYDFSIYFGTTKIETIEGVESVADLTSIEDDYVTFTAHDVEKGSNSITANAGTNLSGGTSADLTADDLTAFLDALENINFNAVAFPFKLSTSGASAAVISKIKYIREKLGHTGQFVVSGVEANYEGIINVINGVVLEDGTEIDAYKATSFIAGATAGAAYNKSNTSKEYPGAVSVNGLLKSEEAGVAISEGKVFFSLNNSGSVVIEDDINSLVTFEGKHEGYKKNRFIRTIDQLFDTLQKEFPPGKFDNIASDWDVMESMGNAILKEFEDDRAIKDVDYENDFKVDRASSVGDSTYFDLAIKLVDSTEKLYFTIHTSV